MLLAPLALAPSVMVAASAAERRCGPAVAGWLVAAPVSLAVALLALGPASGPVAESAAAHVPAQIAFALAFAAFIRSGALAGFGAGVAAYAAVSIALPEPAGLALAVPVLLLASRFGGVPSTEAKPARARRRSGRESRRPGELAVRAGVAALFVAAIYVAMTLVGPQVAGAVAAFPAMSGSLALLIRRAEGPEAARQALRGLVHGLGGYFAFAGTVALIAPSPAAIPAGLIACAVVGRVAWRAVRGARRTAVAASAAC